ncbi:uncharacterized protein LOC127648346 [Xyrauchen texanus]|uniref:uncharacterized protein LOC127648346 n=1 Tax=Xyrauchen texanus TaxID=154827 RepID=UPI002241F4A4|nr:uncharacterized protein LOC127648346 [Xyrauchen texanus]
MNKSDENKLESRQKSWLTTGIKKTMKNNLKIFKNFINSKECKAAKFIVSSKEMENNPGSCILLYEDECDEDVCFIPPSKPARPIPEEIKADRVVLKVTSCPATVEIRLLFKMKEESDWTSQPVLKNTNTVTVTDLRADTEYQMKCAAVGKLNYTVDSDVITVTTKGSTRNRAAKESVADPPSSRQIRLTVRFVFAALTGSAPPPGSAPPALLIGGPRTDHIRIRTSDAP